jgi:hypothetical protein
MIRVASVIILISLILLPISSAFSQTAPCGVPIVWQPTPLQAQATLNPFNGMPIILVHPSLPHIVGSAGMRFVLAHECAHHNLNHVMLNLQILSTNPYAMPWLNPKIELHADCEAGRYLRKKNDSQAIQAGIQLMGNSGPFPTGPNYPTGNERVTAIRYGAQGRKC